MSWLNRGGVEMGLITLACVVYLVEQWALNVPKAESQAEMLCSFALVGTLCLWRLAYGERR